MAIEKKSTDAFDAALKNALRGAVASDPADCPSPEILAAYYDRTLSRTERARVDSHLVSCVRCRSMMASIARADEDPAAPQVRSLSWVTRLFAPVAIVAVVVTIAIGVRNRSQPPEVIALNSRDNSVQSEEGAAPAPAAVPQSAAAPIAQPMGEFQKSEAAEDAMAKSSSGAESKVARALGAPAGAGAAKLLATEPPPNQISSPDGSVLWRFGAHGEIMRSGNSRPWLPMRTGATADILAASAPSNDVAWFAGNSGTIVRTRDGGAMWQLVRPPKNTDFTSITATDSNNATISTASGESFVTRDGGVTWSSS